MLILASASPRRQELLARITPDFVSIPASIDERALPVLAPAPYVQSLAVAKARAVAAAHPGAQVIAADTMVALDDQLLGKPADAAAAKAMIRALAGRHHQVYTGMCFIDDRGEHAVTVQTDVTFWPLTDAEIDAYIAGGAWRDKAGAYGIQDDGALLIQGITGDYYNVMGLPISTLARLMR